MKRVVMTHPDVKGEKSFLPDRAEWLKSRDARWKEVQTVSPLEKLVTKQDASIGNGNKEVFGGAEKSPGDRGSKKARGTNTVPLASKL